MAQNHENGLRTWIEIDRRAIKKNYDTFRSLIPKTGKLMAVVKSNAYGHGLTDFSKEMEKNGVDFFGVDSVVEALALRRDGIKRPILVLGFTLPEKLLDVVNHDITISVSNFEILDAIVKADLPRPLSVHIKVDTGMHRQGFLLCDIAGVLKRLKSIGKKINVTGLFTHFSTAKNPSFPQYTKQQLGEFETWRFSFKKAGYEFISHAAATGGTLLFPESHFDMVRIGIGLYGLWPAKEIEMHLSRKIKLFPVLSWKTIISEVKELPAGSKIGYDGVETLSEMSTIAVCPIGYWHGYPRALSSVGKLLVRGKFCKVIGRVSMDMITIDVTKTKAKVGDHVTIIGKDGEESITAYDLAFASDTSHYEIVTRINPLIKKIYL